MFQGDDPAAGCVAKPPQCRDDQGLVRAIMARCEIEPIEVEDGVAVKENELIIETFGGGTQSAGSPERVRFGKYRDVELATIGR